MDWSGTALLYTVRRSSTLLLLLAAPRLLFSRGDIYLFLAFVCLLVPYTPDTQ